MFKPTIIQYNETEGVSLRMYYGQLRDQEMSLRVIEHTFLDEVKNLATRHEAFYEKGLQDLDRVVSEFKSWRSK